MVYHKRPLAGKTLIQLTNWCKINKDIVEPTPPEASEAGTVFNHLGSEAGKSSIGSVKHHYFNCFFTLDGAARKNR